MAAHILQRLIAGVPSILWREHNKALDGGEGVNAKAFAGFDHDGWFYLVVSFDIEGQGFPKGSKGFDGAVNDGKGGTCRLPRDMAERLYGMALGADKAPPLF